MSDESFPPGMSPYVLGLLYRVAGRADLDENVAEELQSAHVAHIQRLLDSGVALVAGPLLDDGDLRGVLLFPDRPLDEIRAAFGDDPAVREGRLSLELHPLMAQDGIAPVRPR